MSGVSAAGLYNGGSGGCYSNACTVGSNCLSCGSTVQGAKWATVSRTAHGSMAGQASRPQLGPGGKPVGATPRSGRRSLDSNNDPPRNSGSTVGAVPNNHNDGATPNDRPKNVGATPRAPLQDLLNQLKGDPYPGYPSNGNKNGSDGYSNNGNGGYSNNGNGGYSNNGNGEYSNNGHGGINKGENVGASRNNPWEEFFEKLRGWGNRKAKGEVGRAVPPNRATVAGHRFNLELMSIEQRFEMCSAISNHTQYEDLARSLIEFEINEE